MTSRESFFNKGIYKNTLRRFRMGSALYFLLMFLCVPLPMLTRGITELTNAYFQFGKTAFTNEKSLLFDGSFMYFPMLVSFAVPTVVALLVYNSFHSPRHAIFVHSLPVCRRANFISSALAALTLMWLPIALTGAILLVMGVCGYARVIGILPIFMWVFMHLFITGVMFAAASFAAVISANSFAVVGVNALFWALPVCIGWAMQLFAEQFLFGYYNGSLVTERIAKVSMPVWLFSLGDGKNTYYLFKHMATWLFVAGAIVLLAVSLLLYKKRRIELCGDVAAYTPVRSILKYIVCAITFVLCFGIFYCGLAMSAWAFVLISVVICSVVYFACEMLLQKNMRVFGKWKGLCGFGAGCAIVMLFVIFTSVFGYETRIPDKSDIAEATIYDYVNAEVPYLDNPRFTEDVTAFHKAQISNIVRSQRVLDKNFQNSDDESINYVIFSYKLKNGKTLVRQYPLNNKDYDEVMSKMFEYPLYKEKVTGYSVLITENVKKVPITIFAGNLSYNREITQNTQEFLAAVKEDIDKISYKEFREVVYPNWEIQIEEDITRKNPTDLPLFKEAAFPKSDGAYRYFGLGLNKNYKECMKFLKESGIYDETLNRVLEKTYITADVLVRKGKNNSYGNETRNFEEEEDILLSRKYLKKVDTEDVRRFIQDGVLSDDFYRLPDGEYYMLFITDSDDIYSSSAASYIRKENLPDYLEKYIK